MRGGQSRIHQTEQPRAIAHQLIVPESCPNKAVLLSRSLPSCTGSAARAYAEIKAGRLRVRKVGKRRIITPEDAKEWRDRLPIKQPCAPIPSRRH
jgi:hypothetical protein